MDPNRWPAFVWMVIAVGFGSIVCALALFVFKAIFRRKPGWFADSALLGISGFVLVVAMMAYLSLAGTRIPKEWQKVGGYFVLCAVGLPLAWVSRQILRRRTVPQRRRKHLSATGEFTVPEDFNHPLPKSSEDKLYK